MSMIKKKFDEPMEGFSDCIQSKKIEARANSVSCGDAFWKATVLCSGLLPLTWARNDYIDPVSL